MTKQVRDLLILADREECAGYIRIARELREKAKAMLTARGVLYLKGW